MKKVLVLAAAIALFATPALAAITGSKHDLSAAGAGTTELCIFCHTPHAAGALNGAPLWNRNSTDAGVTALYTSNTVTAATAAVNATSLNGTDVVLCLSCHDGAKLQSVTLNNVPSTTVYNPAAIPALTGNTDLTTDLSNDHPIGMNYAAAQGADGGLVAPASGSAVVAGIPLFSGIMWCSSCHSVHDTTNVPFLRVSNAGSNLCKSCHAK